MRRDQLRATGHLLSWPSGHLFIVQVEVIQGGREGPQGGLSSRYSPAVNSPVDSAVDSASWAMVASGAL